MDTLFLIASKIAWFFLRPETILCLLFFVPLVMLLRNNIKMAKATLTLAVTTLVLIGLFPIGNLILNPLERAYPAGPEVNAPAGIIVLGGMEDQAPDYTGAIAQVNDAGERLIATLELANRFPDAIVLFSGGKVALRPAEEGDFSIGPDILRRLGLPEERLVIEDQSRTTAENAILALENIGQEHGGAWILVTSAWHMPRSLGTFCAAGWQNLIPYPVDYRGGPFIERIGWGLAGNLDKLNIGVKEWIGLLAYRLTGRTTAFFPEGCA